MPVGAWLELDLLRRRRQALALPAPKPINPRQLLLRGSAIGGGMTSLVLVACIALYLLAQILYRRERDLQSDVITYDTYQQEIRVTRQRQQKLMQANQSLARAISGLTSGSALLTEVSRLTPKAVQLTKLHVEDGLMKISASSPQPLGLNLANAFQLSLEESPFFGAETVALVNATEIQSSGAAGFGFSLIPTPSSSSPKATFLTFDLRATFSTDESRFNRNRLLNLGAVGLARRLQLLEQEGLIQ